MQLRALALALTAGSAALLHACGGSDATPGIGAADGGDEATEVVDSGVAAGSATSLSDAAAAGDALTPVACAGKTGLTGKRTVSLPFASGTRTFDLHVPATYDPTKKTPLVLLFHGYTMTPASVAEASRFAAVADSRGMIVAFPSGTNGGFNAGECCGSAASSNVDDVGFTKAILTALRADYCIDDKRVFSTGFSNGGFFSYRLACEMADTFAAIAPVAGVIGIDPATCTPSRPVPVLHIHGTGDVVVPYLGGGVGLSRSVATTVDAFKTKNACPAGDGKVVYTKSDVACRTWGPCAAGSEVELCTVTGGGHQWPGGVALPYGGAPTTNLDASAVIADFFAKHPMP